MRLNRAVLAALAFSAGAAGQDGDHLISGPGSTLTENKCKICHELAHIRRAQLSPGEWADNVKNMRERGAPIDDGEAAVIHKYLAVYYNRDVPAPAPAPDTLAPRDDDPVHKLLTANACTGCHATEKRVVGPSFREISAKYAGDSSAPVRLVAKVRAGGAGSWGQVPMPPNPAIAEAELQAMVGWVLSVR